MKKYDLEKRKIDTRTIELEIWGVDERHNPATTQPDTLFFTERYVEKYDEGENDGNGGTKTLTKEEWDYVYKNRDELIQLINEDIEDYLHDGSIQRLITDLLENK